MMRLGQHQGELHKEVHVGAEGNGLLGSSEEVSGQS